MQQMHYPLPDWIIDVKIGVYKFIAFVLKEQKKYKNKAAGPSVVTVITSWCTKND